MEDLLDLFTRECARQGLDPAALSQGSLVHRDLHFARHSDELKGLCPLGWAKVQVSAKGSLERSLTMSRVYFGKPQDPSEDRSICYDLDLAVGIKDTSGSVTFRLFEGLSISHKVYNRHLARLHHSYGRVVKMTERTLPPPRELMDQIIAAYVEIIQG